MPSNLSLWIIAGYSMAAHFILAANGETDNQLALFVGYVSIIPVAWHCAMCDRLEGRK